MTDDMKYNPIHTVAAPNLNKNIAYNTHNDFINEPDNQLYEQKEHFNQITFRPLTVQNRFLVICKIDFIHSYFQLTF